jgi:PPK2 family polyphosphate:nucleotide phosphotransferase
MKTDSYRVRPGKKLHLDKIRTDDDGGLDKPKAQAQTAKLGQRLADLQEVLYAQGTQALLIVLQAMDCGGKDSTIRTVLAPINPQGCKVISFKGPNDVERRHDFLWRIHQNVPRAGYVGVFNRSHYEDVLIVRVKSLLPEERWRPRYDHINAFEQLLNDEGTRIVKFFLHISKDYQRERLLKRLQDPSKHWKFDPSDLVERQHWDQYQRAYEEALSRCSTKQCPWYVVPAEKRWFRDRLITQVLVETLESMDLKYPNPTIDPNKVVFA